MARQVLLSFAGAAEIPLRHTRQHRIVKQKYQQSQEYRLYQGHRLSAIPGHPGYPEGYGAKWDLVASETNASVASQIIAAALRNHFVTRLGSNYRSRESDGFWRHQKHIRAGHFLLRFR